jgi:hypothetical protein
MSNFKYIQDIENQGKKRNKFLKFLNKFNEKVESGEQN